MRIQFLPHDILVLDHCAHLNTQFLPDFSFGTLCTPKYPVAGTSATIFEWEDSGNGFLRGGHRSLRFPSDTAHSFAQWGQYRFVLAF